MTCSFPTTYRELTANDKTSTIRDITLSVASAVGSLGWIRRSLSRPRVHILLLHHLFPDEREGFRELLRKLAEVSEFVTYSQAMERVRSGRFDRPAVSISFDDGIESCVEAAKIMREFAAQGCFFLCPPIIGEKNGFLTRICG